MHVILCSYVSIVAVVFMMRNAPPEASAGGMRDKNTFGGSGIQLILTGVMLEEKKKITPSLFSDCLQISKNVAFLDSLYRGTHITLQGTCRSRDGFFIQN